MNFSNITLEELLASDDPTIKRHAMGVLKQLVELNNKRIAQLKK